MKKKKVEKLVRKVVREEVKRVMYAERYSRATTLKSLATDPPSKFITEKMMDIVGKTLKINKAPRLYNTPTLEVFDASTT